MRDLAELAQVERTNRIGEFASFCRHLMLARGDPGNAVDLARGKVSQRVLQMLEKASVLPMGGGGAGTGGEQLEGVRLVLGAFSDALKFSSAFAAASAAGLLTKVPLGDSVGLVMSGASAASEVGRGDAIPVHKLDVSNSTVGRRKCSGMVVLSDELLRQSGSVAEQIIVRELRAGVALGLDAAFVSDLMSGLVVYTSTGSPLADARLLLADVSPATNSRPFWIAGTGAATLIATGHAGGVLVAPDVHPTNGGTFINLPLFVSSGINTDTLALVDGAKLAGSLETAEVSYSAQALVEADDAPAAGLSGSPVSLTGMQTGSPTTQLISLWQQNCVGIKVTQYFGHQVVRSGAAAAVSLGVGSPA